MYLFVLCSNGVGRTGAFCAIYAGVQSISQGKGIIEVPVLVRKLRQQRKYMIHEPHHLQFCYEAILYYAKDLLMKSKFSIGKIVNGESTIQYLSLHQLIIFIPCPAELCDSIFLFDTGIASAISSFK